MTNTNDKVQFYYNPMSRGRIVHWMLEECGAPYEIKAMKWDSLDHKKPEYLAINPMGQIPAIVHRGVTVTETAAICAYLADAFPQAQLAPAPGDPERGAYLRWFFFAASNIEPAMMDRSHPRARQAASSMLGYSSYEDVVRTLELTVNKGFVAGGRFSAADLYLSSVLGWYLFQNLLDPRPAFLHYIKRCEDRPGFQRFTEKAGKLS